MEKSPRKIGLVGCGTIGKSLALQLDQGAVPQARLIAMNSRDIAKTVNFSCTLQNPPKVLPLPDLVNAVDIVIEAATGEAVDEIAALALGHGKDLMVLSCGALLNRADLLELAVTNNCTIYVPSGAIAGLDGITSYASGKVDSITMVTRKPPDGLRDAPGTIKSGVDIDSIKEPVMIYEGPVLEACKLFPSNVNVSAALSMAGIGALKTLIQIYVDPGIKQNIHEIVALGEFGSLEIKISNLPSESNPRTGKISAFSALATLKKITSNIRVGT